MINVNYTYYSDYLAIYTNVESVVHLKLMLSVNYTSIKKKETKECMEDNPERRNYFRHMEVKSYEL